MAVDTGLVVPIFFREADFGAEVIGEIFAVEEGVFGDGGDDHELGGGGLHEFEEPAGVGELEVDRGLEFLRTGGARGVVGGGVEVAVDVFTPGADIAEGGAPVQVGADAVAEVGEDGDGGGVGGGSGELGFEEGEHGAHTREEFAVHVGGHFRPRLARDEIEEDVFAEVGEAGIIELEAAVALVVVAFGGGHGFEVGDERTVPRALPAEAENAEERDERLPDEGVFEIAPRAGQGGGGGGPDEVGGVVAEDVVDGAVGDELGGGDCGDIGPVGGGGGVSEAAEGGQAREAGRGGGGEFGVEEAREREADERLVIHHAAGGVVEDGLDALGARLGEGRLFGGVHPALENAAGDAEVFRVLGMRIREGIAADEERRGFVTDVATHARLDVVVLYFEGFDAEDDVEVRVNLGGAGLEIAEDTGDAVAGGFGDFVVVAPLADHVRAAVASDVEGGGVFEASAAVVRPERHVAEIGDGTDEFLEGFAVMATDDGVILRHRETREARAERVVDAGAAQCGIFLEEPLGHRAGFEHTHAGFQAVAAAEVGEFAEMVEVGVEVEGGPETAGEFGVDEVVEARGVGVELRVVFVGDEILVRHVGLETIDLAVGKTGFGEGGDVALGIEAAGGAPVLGVAGVPMGTVPAERRGEENAGGEFLAGEGADAVGEEANGGEEEGAVGGDDLAGGSGGIGIGCGDANPGPGGLGGSVDGWRGRGGRDAGDEVARGEGDEDTARGGARGRGDGGTGEAGERGGRSDFTRGGGGGMENGREEGEGRGSHGTGMVRCEGALETDSRTLAASAVESK